MIHLTLHATPVGRFLAIAALLSASTLFALYPADANQDSEPDAEDSDSATEEAVDFTKLKSPVPYTEKSIARGKTYFRRYCTECHGPDGKALVDVIANATNLTNPKLWRSGTTEGEIFRSIRDGAGVDMPPFSFDIRREEELWHLVNFVRSLWPEDVRPELQEEAASDQSDQDGAKSAEDGGTDREEG